jgi:YbbR domain-containing protein
MKKYQKLLIGAIFASILIGAAFICFKVIDNNNRNNNITNQSNRQKNISNNNKHIIYNNETYFIFI